MYRRALGECPDDGAIVIPGDQSDQRDQNASHKCRRNMQT
jgi:hypothetical protein